MMSRHQALFLIAPLKQREVNNPQTFKFILVTQAKPIAHFQSKTTELNTCLVCIITTKNQYQVTITCTHHFFKFLQDICIIEFIYAAFYRTVFIKLNPNKSFSANLRFLDKISQLIYLLSCIRSTARHTDSANIFCTIEHLERACAL